MIAAGIRNHGTITATVTRAPTRLATYTTTVRNPELSDVSIVSTSRWVSLILRHNTAGWRTFTEAI